LWAIPSFPRRQEPNIGAIISGVKGFILKRRDQRIPIIVPLIDGMGYFVGELVLLAIFRIDYGDESTLKDTKAVMGDIVPILIFIFDGVILF